MLYKKKNSGLANINRNSWSTNTLVNHKRTITLQKSISGTFQASFERIMRSGNNTYGTTALKKLSSQFKGYDKIEKYAGDSKKSKFYVYPGVKARLKGAPSKAWMTMEKVTVSINLKEKGKWGYQDVEVVKVLFQEPLGFLDGWTSTVNPVYIYRDKAYIKKSDGKFYSKFKLQ